jgi:hypothetical protein
MDETKLLQQIERCRRLATWLTDDEVRLALRRLADEYETQLPKQHRRADSFMLGSKSPER